MMLNCPYCKIPCGNIECEYNQEYELEIMKKERASRFNIGKPKISLIPIEATIEEAKVWTMGAAKYGNLNWAKGMPFSEVLDSLERHLIAFKSGQDNDVESKCHHMAHIRCNAAMLIHFVRHNPEFDDRMKLDIGNVLLGENNNE